MAFLSRAVALALLTALPSPPRALAEEAQGTLFVVSYPRGEVVVDGRPSGVRTPATDLPVAAGEREIEVRWEERGRSTPQRVVVSAGETSHVFFREEPVEVGEEYCDGSHEDACFGWVTEAVDRADADAVIARAEVYLSRHPRGAYAKIAQTIVDSEEIILAEERRVLRSVGVVLSITLLSLAGLAIFLRRRARRLARVASEP